VKIQCAPNGNSGSGILYTDSKCTQQHGSTSAVLNGNCNKAGTDSIGNDFSVKCNPSTFVAYSDTNTKYYAKVTCSDVDQGTGKIYGPKDSSCSGPEIGTFTNAFAGQCQSAGTDGTGVDYRVKCLGAGAPPNSGSSASSHNAGMIIGIIIGVLAVVGIIVGVWLFAFGGLQALGFGGSKMVSAKMDSAVVNNVHV